jgi:hypothetical protein
VLRNNTGKGLPVVFSIFAFIGIFSIAGFVISKFLGLEGPKALIPSGVMMGGYLLWIIVMNTYDSLSSYVEKKIWVYRSEKRSKYKEISPSDVNIPEGKEVKVSPGTFSLEGQKFTISKAWIALANYDEKNHKKYLHMEIPGMEDEDLYGDTNFWTYEHIYSAYSFERRNSRVFALPVENIDIGKKMNFYLVFKGKQTNLWFHVRVPD